MAFVITLLKGRAREWATVVWDARAPFCATFQDFRAEIIKLFDRSAQGDEAASQLARLNQDGHSVTDYSIQFRTLAATCDWNEAALCARFREGLDDEIQDEIIIHELPRDFDSLVELALRVEGRLQRRHQRWMAQSPWTLGEGANSALTALPPVADPEPMQVGRLHLTIKDKQDPREISWMCLLQHSGVSLTFLSLLPSLSGPSMAFSSPPSPTPLLH